MATRTRTRTVVDSRSKSQVARDLLKKGLSISDIEKEMTRLGRPMGYAFVYGVADRTPHPEGGTYASRAANRRPTRAMVKNADGSVTIQTTAGPVTVDVDGTCHRGKKVWKVQTTTPAA